MIKQTLKPCVLILSFLLFSNVSLAQIPLNESVINHWIKSQSAFEAWGKQHSAQLNNEVSDDNLASNSMDMSISTITLPLKRAGLYKSASKLVKQFQFEHLEDWADITIRITSAAASIEFENNPQILNDYLESNSELETLQNSNKLSPEQKTLISQAIQQNKTIVKRLIENTSKVDKEAIKPFLTRIHKLMSEPY